MKKGTPLYEETKRLYLAAEEGGPAPKDAEAVVTAMEEVEVKVKVPYRVPYREWCLEKLALEMLRGRKREAISSVIRHVWMC